MSDMSNRALPRLVYSGTPIAERGEMLCLTDMWRAAGSDPSKRPVDWERKESASQFIDFIEDSLKVSKQHLWISEPGRHGGGTWAHWQIGMAYAKYLSPEFHAWCNEVVRAHMEGRGLPIQATEGAITLSTAHLDRVAEKMGEAAARTALGFIESKVMPRFDRVDHQNRLIEERLSFLEKRIRKRRTVSDTTKALIISWVVMAGGWCPHCRKTKIVEDGRLINNAQIDHVRDVGDNSATGNWLVCGECHGSFKPRGHLSRTQIFPIFDGWITWCLMQPGAQTNLFELSAS